METDKKVKDNSCHVALHPSPGTCNCSRRVLCVVAHIVPLSTQARTIGEVLDARENSTTLSSSTIRSC